MRVSREKVILILENNIKELETLKHEDEVAKAKIEKANKRKIAAWEKRVLAKFHFQVQDLTPHVSRGIDTFGREVAPIQIVYTPEGKMPKHPPMTYHESKFKYHQDSMLTHMKAELNVLNMSEDKTVNIGPNTFYATNKLISEGVTT